MSLLFLLLQHAYSINTASNNSSLAISTVKQPPLNLDENRTYNSQVSTKKSEIIYGLHKILIDPRDSCTHALADSAASGIL